MKLAVPMERRANEARVAATPDTVKRLKGLGLDVVVETGAGTGTSIPDQAFVDAGATIAPDEACLLYTSPSPRDGLLSRMPSSA